MNFTDIVSSWTNKIVPNLELNLFFFSLDRNPIMLHKIFYLFQISFQCFPS